MGGSSLLTHLWRPQDSKWLWPLAGCASVLLHGLVLMMVRSLTLEVVQQDSAPTGPLPIQLVTLSPDTDLNAAADLNGSESSTLPPVPSPGEPQPNLTSQNQAPPPGATPPTIRPQPRPIQTPADSTPPPQSNPTIRPQRSPATVAPTRPAVPQPETEPGQRPAPEDSSALQPRPLPLDEVPAALPREEPSTSTPTPPTTPPATSPGASSPVDTPAPEVAAPPPRPLPNPVTSPPAATASPAPSPGVEPAPPAETDFPPGVETGANPGLDATAGTDPGGTLTAAIRANPNGRDIPEVAPRLQGSSTIAVQPLPPQCAVANLSALIATAPAATVQLAIMVEADGQISSASVVPGYGSGTAAVDDLVSCLVRQRLTLNPAYSGGSPIQSDAFILETRIAF